MVRAILRAGCPYHRHGLPAEPRTLRTGPWFDLAVFPPPVMECVVLALQVVGDDVGDHLRRPSDGDVEKVGHVAEGRRHGIGPDSAQPQRRWPSR